MKEELKKKVSIALRDDYKPLHEMLPLKQPLRVQIDPTDICNFRCNMCFHSKVKLEGSMMTLDTYKRIIEQLLDFDEPISSLQLVGLGEPLLNKNIDKFISIAKENKVANEVTINTNGSLLTHDLSERLIEAGLDRLVVSLNGLSSEDYFKFANVKIDFEKKCNELKYFFNIRKKCKLIIRTIDEYFTEQKKDAFVEMFKDISDRLFINHMENVWPDLQVLAEDKIKNDNKVNKELSVCPMPFYVLLIHPNGEVSPCCVDYKFKSNNLGNINSDTLKNIWSGLAISNLRYQTLKGKEIDYKGCKGCTYAEYSFNYDLNPYRDDLLKKFTNV